MAQRDNAPYESERCTTGIGHGPARRSLLTASAAAGSLGPIRLATPGFVSGLMAIVPHAHQIGLRQLSL
jgi:hypothetical protein